MAPVQGCSFVPEAVSSKLTTARHSRKVLLLPPLIPEHITTACLTPALGICWDLLLVEPLHLPNTVKGSFSAWLVSLNSPRWSPARVPHLAQGREQNHTAQRRKKKSDSALIDSSRSGQLSSVWNHSPRKAPGLSRQGNSPEHIPILPVRQSYFRIKVTFSEIVSGFRLC